ncbi:MAG: flagellar export chaperone FliS [Sphingomonas aquatilis]|jgi:flagellar protein FliS|uniref:Flagellar secretion chaperone FliS n=2 Tax=Sphingomonas melonis TaxID=152682 RepID=A0A0D1M3Y4_9SPHN|nr:MULTISPECIES: flagellar export chaperone FliS [Sphingomonas]AOW22391.1 flagellar export chaperone FliS [Sphingomonas melonis TY]ATI55778.1 flagellar export chaperone FliS [Sphingomonas melonis]KIU26665.1 flagellar biosynthesis protein FliS [Sphingomonas melonis]KZB95700.1 flagellar export chaperone FliS [Sphingomonas melonis TY]MBI0532532.1 flagellar export chaperone FliS [Sphingomonas sp. TX0522]
MAYATALSGDPYATYRQIDVVGRTAEAQGPGLVQLLYEELISALRAAAWAMDNNQLRTKSERVTRATAILFALESGLDFERGGEVSNTLARLYAGIRRTVVDASVGSDSAPFRDAASSLSEIAEAWRTARAA